MSTFHNMRHIYRSVLLLLLAAAIAFPMTACYGVKAEDLMSGIHASSVQSKTPDAAFLARSADFSVNLFKQTAGQTGNTLLSPLSVQLALAMTANGAAGQTLAQMDKVLGGELTSEELNKFLYAYVKSLPNDKDSRLTIANSFWFRDGLTVNSSFLQKNANYYGADAYRSAFDGQTVKDINNWVKKKTDGTIDSVLKTIGSDEVMVILNAIVFDAEWKVNYFKNDLSKGTFTDADGNSQSVTFMHSGELLYLNDDSAVGFTKPYRNGYSFAALLPNEGIALDDYIRSMTGEKFMKTIQNAKNDSSVDAMIPKFEYDYSVKLNDALTSLGMPDAFSENADFSGLATENTCLSEVLHKTYIRVDEHGTKAGAVTKATIAKSANGGEIQVHLNRPFVYAIIDNATKLPVFIGVVRKI